MLLPYLEMSPDEQMAAMAEAGYNGGRGGRVSLFGPTGERVTTTSPVTAIQRVSFAVTDFVLRSGPSTDVDVSTGFWPVVRVPKRDFTLPRDLTDDLVDTDTERPAKGNMKFSNIGVDEVRRIAKRYTFAYLADDIQIENASMPWDVQVMGALKAQKRVLGSLDKSATVLLNNTANFNATVIVGDTWSVNGTSLDQINLAANILVAATGRPKSRFRVAIFNPTAQTAALTDKNFLERRSKVQGATNPTLQDLASYWGVEGVDFYQPISRASIDSAPAFRFPNNVVVYFPGDPAQLGTWYGDQAWGRTFRVLDGAALAPFRINEQTSWAFPWQVEQTQEILDPTCAVLITSPS